MLITIYKVDKFTGFALFNLEMRELCLYTFIFRWDTDLPFSCALNRVHTISPIYFGSPGYSIYSVNNASILICPYHQIMAHATRRLAAWRTFMSMCSSNKHTHSSTGGRNQRKLSHPFKQSCAIGTFHVKEKKKVVCFMKDFMRAALKVMPPILLCWSMMSEVDIGGMAVKVEPSLQHPIKFYCCVTVWQNGIWCGSV